MVAVTSFISQRNAELLRNPCDTRSLISITGPIGQSSPMGFGNVSKLANLELKAWKNILRLQFHDLAPSKYANDNGKILFDEKMSIQIFKFLKENEDQEEIVVHCEAGVSRSAAVSKFIARIYNLGFPEDYDYYNQHVFGVLLKTYGICLSGSGEINPSDLPSSYKEI